MLPRLHNSTVSSPAPAASRAITFCLALAGSTLLTACASTQIAGRVIPGPIGRSLVLVTDDDRFETPGLAGVRVEILQDTSGSLVRVAEATSTDTGDFTARIADGKLRAGPISVRASADSVFQSTTKVTLPLADQRLLVQVVPRTPGASTAPEAIAP